MTGPRHGGVSGWGRCGQLARHERLKEVLRRKLLPSLIVGLEDGFVFPRLTALVVRRPVNTQLS